ncbi:hypothetical protein NL108_015782 [Boleophthalmus pectinirostris]|nr:hypothetical protein NL108_015782 [Boleophthalmus pectinirostris]
MIVSVQNTVLDNLGVAGFVLSALALILVVAGLVWLFRPKFSTTETSLNISTGAPSKSKDLEMAPPVDTDVYMNCSSPNEIYTDLDPSTITEDGIYTSFQ